MKYFIKTCEYLFKLEKGKRFFVLFLFALPIGVAIAAAMPQGSLINWLSDFNAATSFREAWSYNGNINILVSGLAVPITFVLILFFLSVMTTVISRSLRVGVFKAESVFRDCNESFIPVLQGAFGYIVTALLLKVLMTLLLQLISRIELAVIAAILTAIVAVITYVGFFMLLTLGILYLPFMSFNGLGTFEAFIQAAGKLSGGTYRRMAFAVIIPSLIVPAIGMAVGVAHSLIASVIVESVLNAVLLTYIVTLAFVSYYEILGLTREDYPREYFYYKPPRRR
ncbi:MAG TPA: hypothetical protein IAB05_03410 [Candidatus Stercoripulliclostridium merdigallinarum]|uniref:Uncharacterized protein n=1 Tax=Candidatus Stercoripulliclostridium merdigallinarum TaxID=2840951 RepID=A0A9D1SHB0_9FIRM|nr:hypothetical protein [Candidatus Stercoripulliclostridium merdigallinarum]